MQLSPGTHFRWILILLVPVVAGTLFLFSNPYSLSFYHSSLFFEVYAFVDLPLATLEWYYAYSAGVQTRKLLLLFSIGIATTLGSAFHTTLLVAAGPCAPGVSGGGFPLPWYLTFILYTGHGPFPPCPFLLDRPWGTFAVFSFLFNTVFYAAVALAGNEFYRWAKRNTLPRGSNPSSGCTMTIVVSRSSSSAKCSGFRGLPILFGGEARLVLEIEKDSLPFWAESRRARAAFFQKDPTTASESYLLLFC